MRGNKNSIATNKNQYFLLKRFCGIQAYIRNVGHMCLIRRSRV